MKHKVKILPKYLQAVLKGEKTFEIRKNDRGYKVGDIIELREWDLERNRCTGLCVRKKITYVLEDFEGIKEGFCILGLGGEDNEDQEHSGDL